MKKLFLPFIIVLIALLSVFPSNASIVSSVYPDFEFDADYDNAYSVAGYNGTGGEVIIPEELYGREIKRFSEKAFYKNSVINSLYMHDKMTVVNKWAFRNCPNLSRVYFSKSLVSLWDFAFAQAPNLKSAFLRNTNLNTIYQSCFYNDTSLKHLSLPETLETIGASAFSKTALEIVVIPKSVTAINNNAFANNENLREIYIPRSVKKIGKDVFAGSENVTVYVSENSETERYCEENSLKYKVIEESDFPSNLLGDVDNNRELDVRDATAIMQEIAELELNFFAQNCDYNSDGELNVKDATMIMQHIAQIE
ncbi:MAG: leucine-rich repeat protein [Ruminococcus sp.]|nr:leucine-rich repeat protein [Ruminococcus sp.]